MVSRLPVLNHITTPHADNSLFNASDNKTITIHADFSGEVTPNIAQGTPRIKLGGFTDGATRYANYVSKSGTQLTFQYSVQPGDESNRITIPLAAPLDLNGGYIDAIIPGVGGEPSWTDSSKIFTGTKTLKVDGVAPKITGVAVTGAPAKTPVSSLTYYRAGETLEATVTFDKPVMILGSPSFKLKVGGGGSVDASFLRVGGANSAVFQYRIASGVNAAPVQWDPAACFSASDALTVVDRAGNPVAGAGTPGSTSVVIDTTPPAAPVLTEAMPSGIRTYTIGTVNIEPNATVHYSKNHSLGIWEPISSPYSPFAISGDGGYAVAARQTDLAGNVSELSNTYNFTIGGSTTLIGISCDNPDGTYPKDDMLTFKLIFSGQVYTSSTGAKITLQDGGSTLQIPVTQIPIESASNFLYFYWRIPEGKDMSPVAITAVELTNVAAKSSSTITVSDMSNTISTYNSSRDNLKVRSVRPVITAKVPDNNAVATVSQIQLTFDTPVFKETGTITVKPAAGWLVPPVLTSAEFTAFSSSVQTALIAGGYVKTTHGLKESSGKYVPDTATKYVLTFNKGLDDTTLRGIFNGAKFRWQEIDVTNPSVTINDKTVTIALDGALPVGRQWDVSITDGTFRDEAGNTSAALTTGSYTFWSDKVAEPVIRVNRISSNSVSMPASATTESAALSGKTQFRIDSETTDAVIVYGTSNQLSIDLIKAINSSMTSSTDFGGGMGNTGNSDIADISTTDLTGLTVGTNYTSGGMVDIGNASTADYQLYSAGKYYIAAKATKTDFDESDKSYEGAFKTLLVYRNPKQGNGSGNALSAYMKVEGADTPGGAVTIAGFPLSNNDMTGQLNKLLYKKTGQSGSGNDHIWISWEIVSDWYQTAFGVTSDTAGMALITAGAKWGDGEYVFANRKYGNYGLRVESTVRHD